MTPQTFITRCDECDWQGEPADGCPACEQNERMTNSAGEIYASADSMASALKTVLVVAKIPYNLAQQINHELRSWRALESHILGE